MDLLIEDYVQIISNGSFNDALGFWKTYEKTWPLLAELAKRYLGVPATGASNERDFSISGHIFSNKRRNMGLKLFEQLVFLKLNEKFF